MLWPDGSDQVTWRSRLRCGSEVGGWCEAIAPSGRLKSGVEIVASISLFGFTLPSPKSKKVCQPMKRRGALELDRHERHVRPVELAPTVEDFLRQLSADEERQELVNDHPVVMLGGEPTCLFEHLFSVHARAVPAHVIDRLVVEQEERGMQAGDDDVLVVAGIDDDRGVVARARQVLEQAAALDPELDSGARLVQLGRQA